MKAKKKNTVKKPVDACMTVLLLCLMAYQVTGETLHEWFGVGMTVLLIVHHILNRKWYAVLFRGKYTAFRILTTIVNTLLLASIALTALCGVSMSGHAVPFLYGMLPLSFARRFHLAMSFWSFVLMGLHLGLHLPAMTAKMKPGKTAKALLTCLCIITAGIGLGLFLRNRIPDYLFFRTPFAFFDYDKQGVLVFLENLAELFFFAFLGANTVYLMQSKRKRETGKRAFLLPILCLLFSLLIGAGIMLRKGEADPSSGREEPRQTESAAGTKTAAAPAAGTEAPDRKAPVEVADGFVLISGGTFFMGSPENENWRIGDETLHEVSVSSFFMDPYETTQKEYERLMGMNPSAFIGSDLPVESMISRKKRSFPSVPMEADGLGRALQRSQSLRRMQVWVKACRSIIPAEEPCRKTFPHGLTETALNESEVQR